MFILFSRIVFQRVSYKLILFANNLNQIDERTANLLNSLIYKLNEMEKEGPISGSCEIETRQMEKFLKENFHFDLKSSNNILGDNWTYQQDDARPHTHYLN